VREIRSGLAFIFLTVIFAAPLLFAGAESGGGAGSRRIDLAEVLRLALKNNFDIRIARLEQDMNRYRSASADSVYDTLLTASADYTYDELKKSSEYYGELSRTGNLNFQLAKKFSWGTDLKLDFSNQYTSSDSFFATLDPAYDSRLEISFAQPLLKDWSGELTRGEIELARIELANLDLLAWENMEDVLSLTASTYWELVEMEKEVALEVKMEERARYLYELSREQIEMGMIEEVDLVAAEANLKIREAEVVLGREELTNKSRLLQFLIDDPSENIFLPADGLEIIPDEKVPDFTAVLKTALENRWDYRRALRELEAKELEVEMKENSLWPQVDLVGSFARNGLSEEWGRALDGIFSEDNPRYYIGLQLSHFLENRRADSEEEIAELEKSKALVQIKKLEREIYTRIDEKLRAVRVSRDLARRESEIQKLQQDKLNEEEERFEYGRSNSKTIIDYQNDLLLAQLNLAHALAVYHKSLVDLQVAQGIFLKKQMGMR